MLIYTIEYSIKHEAWFTITKSPECLMVPLTNQSPECIATMTTHQLLKVNHVDYSCYILTFQCIDTLTSRVPSVGIWLWGSQVEGAGRSGGCSGAWPHTVCRTQEQEAEEDVGMHTQRQHFQHWYMQQCYVLLHVHRHNSLPVDLRRETVSPPGTISHSSASHNSTRHYLCHTSWRTGPEYSYIHTYVWTKQETTMYSIGHAMGGTQMAVCWLIYTHLRGSSLNRNFPRSCSLVGVINNVSGEAKICNLTKNNNIRSAWLSTMLGSIGILFFSTHCWKQKCKLFLHALQYCSWVKPLQWNQMSLYAFPICHMKHGQQRGRETIWKGTIACQWHLS